VKVRNLEVRRTGPGAGKARLVVIGAHYDSAQGAVGADDNGSGVAALLELARLLKSVQPAEGWRCGWFFYVNEELPWFATEKMGSLVHANGLALGEREVVAMLALRDHRLYSDAPGSQRYPFPSTCSIRLRATSSPSSPIRAPEVFCTGSSVRSGATRRFHRRARWGWSRSRG